MKEQYNVSLRESLEQLPTLQLDAMLRAELEKEIPDEQAVRLMLKILREREAGFPVVSNPQIDDAWKRFREKTSGKSNAVRRPLIKAAALLILCGLLLFALPQDAQAENFFDRITAWTENAFMLFSKWNRDDIPKEYEFHTDHPGLQELYDAVSELGVTVPVVPMWLDDGYILEYWNKMITPTCSKVNATFLNGEKAAVFELNIYADNIPREFHKNDETVGTYESNGIAHYIFRNNELWTVVWTQDNIDCAIAIACPQSDLFQVIDSIYTSEE